MWRCPAASTASPSPAASAGSCRASAWWSPPDGLAPGPRELPAGARYLPKPVSSAGLVGTLRGVLACADGRPGVTPAAVLMHDPSTLPHAPLSEVRPSLDPEE